MEQVAAKLTVLFAEPFWIGVYERHWQGRYEVCRMVFGAEPKSQEVYEYLQRRGRKLRFAVAESEPEQFRHPINPKRLQRKIRRSMAVSKGIGESTAGAEASAGSRPDRVQAASA